VNSVDIYGLRRIFYNGHGQEIGRNQRWKFWSTTKYIQGSGGNVAYAGNRFWEVWEYDAGYLNGKANFAGVENYDEAMNRFVCENANQFPTLQNIAEFLSQQDSFYLGIQLLQFHMLSILTKSPEEAAWDLKQKLNSEKWYTFDGKAYRYDSIGNITWGGIMKSYGWPERLSKLGAGAYQLRTDYRNKELSFWRTIKRIPSYGDDPRDTAAIHIGYKKNWR